MFLENECFPHIRLLRNPDTCHGRRDKQRVTGLFPFTAVASPFYVLNSADELKQVEAALHYAVTVHTYIIVT